MAHSRAVEADQQVSFVDTVTDYAIYFFDKAGHIRHRNLPVDHIDGYLAKDLPGIHLRALFTPEDQGHGLPAAILGRAEREGRDEFIGWLCRKDGSRFWGRLTINPVRDKADRLTGFAGVLRDITDRYEALRRLDRMREELAEARKMQAIGQLIRGIGHDFSNILMIILGNGEIARTLADRSDVPADLRTAIDRVMHGGQRAATLVQGLAAFAHEGPLTAKSAPIAINAFLERLPATLRSRLASPIGIEVIGQGLWSALGDEARLADALVELAANSAEAMAGSGRVVIEAANVFLDADYCTHNPEVSPGAYVQIAVTDTGEGMSKETLSRALEPYFSTRARTASRGLGLARVYGIVKEAGGHIKLYSEQGVGTTVKLYLRTLDAGEAVVQSEISVPVAFVNETVLVVDDDPDIRGHVVRVLRELNYRVFAAESSEAALELLEQRDIRPDLLLSDVVMPGIGGQQLADEVLRRHPGTKVLFMTGFGRNAVLRSGKIQPGFGVLQKPVGRQMIADSVREILDPPLAARRRRRMDG